MARAALPAERKEADFARLLRAAAAASGRTGCRNVESFHDPSQAGPARRARRGHRAGQPASGAGRLRSNRPSRPRTAIWHAPSAMQLARPLKKNPRDVAQALLDALRRAAGRASAGCERMEIAGPGFINLRLKPRGQAGGGGRGADRQATASGGSRRTAGACWSSSSRPTRPARCTWATAARPRWATPSATCSRPRAGRSTREFYYNDAGVQIATLAASVQARLRGLKPGDAQWPEPAYNGDYIADIAADFTARKTVQADDRRVHRVRRRGRPGRHPPVRGGLPAPRAGPGPAGVRRALRQLLPRVQPVHQRPGRGDGAAPGRAPARPTRQDGALWLRTTDYGDDKDRVMRKSDGTLHLLRARRGLPPRQVRARLRQGHQHPGRRPPRHHRARARRRAGGGRRASRPASPTTCCTRW